MADHILAFKYRIYPTCRQATALDVQLREGCRLYNAALQERRDAWTMQRKRITFYSQDAQLKEIRATGDLQIPGFMVASHVLRRADRAFAAFFRRCRAGQVPGYPRFKRASSFDSLTVEKTKSGARVSGDHFVWLGVGAIKMRVHRPLLGRPRTFTVKREAGRWFAVIVCDQIPATCHAVASESVGIDVGLSTFATLSTGDVIESPRFEREQAQLVRRLSRSVARCRARSRRQQKARRRLAGARAREHARRVDFQHKASRSIVNRFALIAIEDLNIKGMARTRLARSIHDAGWRSFLNKIAYKAANAGRTVVEVNARGTSQVCLCGNPVPKTLADRWHHCEACGLSAPRDLVSAQLIERLGLSRQALTVSRDAVACGAQA